MAERGGDVTDGHGDSASHGGNEGGAVMSPLRVLSLGAGRQSTALLLMSVKGLLPRLDWAIFCDTGWEDTEVYDHLDALTRYAWDEARIPVLRASRGSLPDDVLNRQVFATLPAWTPGGRIKRQCTPRYKVEPLYYLLRELLGARVWEQPCRYCEGTGSRIAPWDPDAGAGPCSVCNGTGTRRRVGSVPKDVQVEQWIGFSADEMDRATTLGFPKWSTPRHPLIEQGWTAADCVRWLSEQGWKGVSRSSCVGCPMHDDDTWLELADERPATFARVADFDERFRTAEGLNEPRFLHERRLPLRDAVEQYRIFKRLSGEQGVLWEEFRAKRKVRRCNPFGCRAEEIDEAPDAANPEGVGELVGVGAGAHNATANTAEPRPHNPGSTGSQ